MTRPPDARGALAVAALLFNAFTWGLSWWPLRWLEARGLHALWATAIVYAVAVVVIFVWQPGAPRHLLRTPRLWWLIVASGTTNACFNWGVTIGDVVRVVLLFYLMPLWAVLLARLLLGERLTPTAALRVVLALAGALIVLWPPGGGWPVPRSLPDALGLLGGFSFALNNVLLRREAAQPGAARALAMFTGGALVSSVLALSLGAAGLATAPPALAVPWLAAVMALALAYLLSNLALQFGAARLPASATAAVMVSEVLFAAVSSMAAGVSSGGAALWTGGSLIVLAALLAAWRH